LAPQFLPTPTDFDCPIRDALSGGHSEVTATVSRALDEWMKPVAAHKGVGRQSAELPELSDHV
jgi:hypothetical protein